MSTKREIAIGLAIAAIIAPLYAVVVVVADFGRDAFYIGFLVVLLIAAIAHDELTYHGQPRRFGPLFRRRAHHSHQR